MDEGDNKMLNRMAGQMASCAASKSCSADLAYEVMASLGRKTAPAYITPSSHQPMPGEKSGPALGLADETNSVCEMEAIIEENSQMANEFKAVKVPSITGATPEQREKAYAEKKSQDPGNENDLFPTSMKQGPFKLFMITARDAVKDSKGKPVLEKGPDGNQYKKMRLVNGLIWLPGAESASLDDMVSWFATKRWGSTEPEYLNAAFTELKEKALAAELIAHRGKMKAVPSGGGKKKGKTRF